MNSVWIGALGALILVGLIAYAVATKNKKLGNLLTGIGLFLAVVFLLAAFFGNTTKKPMDSGDVSTNQRGIIDRMYDTSNPQTLRLKREKIDHGLMHLSNIAIEQAQVMSVKQDHMPNLEQSINVETKPGSFKTYGSTSNELNLWFRRFYVDLSAAQQLWSQEELQDLADLTTLNGDEIEKILQIDTRQLRISGGLRWGPVFTGRVDLVGGQSLGITQVATSHPDNKLGDPQLLATDSVVVIHAYEPVVEARSGVIIGWVPKRTPDTTWTYQFVSEKAKPSFSLSPSAKWVRSTKAQEILLIGGRIDPYLALAVPEGELSHYRFFVFIVPLSINEGLKEDEMSKIYGRLY